MFAFVWLPRDELTTRRRIAIGEMIEQAASGTITNWSVDLGDGDLALVRYTLNVDAKTPTPDVAALDRRLDAMVRGWVPSVEEALGELVGEARATRLALTYLDQFPEGYRIRTGAGRRRPRHRLPVRPRRCRRARRPPVSAATPTPSDRLTSRPTGSARSSRLSEAVPVFENFGFRVLEEVPTRSAAAARPAMSTNSTCTMPGGGDAGAGAEARRRWSSAAIADVLEGKAENDPFNQLIVAAGLDAARGRACSAPGSAICARPAFPIRRSRSSTRCAARPTSTKGLIALFDAMHDPATRGRARRRSQAAERKIERGLADVAAIDEDRILRLIRGVIRATLRTNAFAPSGEEALAFKLDSAPRARPAGAACRGARSGSIRRALEGIHLRGGPIARGGLRWSDRRDDFRTEVLGLMKAQVVKNAVIVPTGAKGGFYPKQLPPAANRDAWLAEGTEILPDLHPRPALGHRQSRRRQGRPPAQGRDPRRRRSLFRRRRRQGHRDLLRRRQCDRDRARLLARRRLRQRRLQRLRPQGDGDHRQGRLGLGPAPLPRARRRRPEAADPGRRRRRHVGRRVRQRHAAFQGDQARRRLRPPPHLPRSRPRSGEELEGAQADVRPAALVLGRLRQEPDLEGRRRLPAQPEVDPAVARKSRAMLGLDGGGDRSRRP